MSWHTLTRAQKDESNRQNRLRYATDPMRRAMFNRYTRQRYSTLQGRLAYKIYRITTGHRGRQSPIFTQAMTSITGLNRDQFTTLFGHGDETDHIIPLSRFDLENPEHLVRACYPTNLRCITRLENLVKSDEAPDNLDVMKLPWVGTYEALAWAMFLIRAAKNPKRGRAT